MKTVICRPVRYWHFNSFRADSKLTLRVFVTLIGLFLSGQVMADCAQPVGRFADIKGQVETQAAESDEWLIANLDSKLCEGS